MLDLPNRQAPRSVPERPPRLPPRTGIRAPFGGEERQLGQEARMAWIKVLNNTKAKPVSGVK